MLYLPILPLRRQGDLFLGRLGKLNFFPLYRLPLRLRAAHLYVIGLSGLGKSKFLENCLYQDIASGMGCGCVDPHSLLIEDLLRYLVTSRAHEDPGIREKLIYIDPTRTDYVVPFNVLATEGAAYDVAAGVLEAFRRTWPESLKEAPHFSNVVTASLITLIANSLTLMHLPALLTDKGFRDRCLEKVSDHSIIEFF